MKKLLIFCFLFISAFIAESQNVDIRIFGGFSLTQTSNDQNNTEIDSVDYTTSYSGRPGFEVGLATTIGYRLFFQPGIKFSQISAEVINESNIDYIKYEDLTTINVVAVSLKVGFRLINQDTEDILNLRVFTGLNGLHVFAVNHSEKSNKIDDLNKDDFQDFVFNAELGAGIDLWIFFMDLGYRMGLTPIFKESAIDVKANSLYSDLGVRIKF